MTEGRVRNNKSFAFSSANSSYDFQFDSLTNQAIDESSGNMAQDDGSPTTRVGELSKALRLTPIFGIVQSPKPTPSDTVDTRTLADILQDSLQPFSRITDPPFISPSATPLRHSKSSALFSSNDPNTGPHLPRPEGRVRGGIPKSTSSNILNRISNIQTFNDPSKEPSAAANVSSRNASSSFVVENVRVKGGQVHERFSGSSRVSHGDLSSPLSQAPQIKSSSSMGQRDLLSILGPSASSSVNPSPRYSCTSVPYPPNPFSPSSSESLFGLLASSMHHNGSLPNAVSTQLVAHALFEQLIPVPNSVSEPSKRHSSVDSEASPGDYKVRGGKALGVNLGSDSGNSSQDFKVRNGSRSSAVKSKSFQDTTRTLRSSLGGLEPITNPDGHNPSPSSILMQSMPDDLHAYAVPSGVTGGGSERGRGKRRTCEMAWIEEEPRAGATPQVLSSSLPRSSSSFASLAAQRLTLLSLKTNFGSSASLSQQRLQPNVISPRISPLQRARSLPWGSYSYGLAASMSAMKASCSSSRSSVISPSKDLGKLSESLSVMKEEGEEEEREEELMMTKEVIDEWEGEERDEKEKEKEPLPMISLIDYAEEMVSQKQALEIHEAVCQSAAALELAFAESQLNSSSAEERESLYERLRVSMGSNARFC